MEGTINWSYSLLYWDCKEPYLTGTLRREDLCRGLTIIFWQVVTRCWCPSCPYAVSCRESDKHIQSELFVRGTEEIHVDISFLSGTKGHGWSCVPFCPSRDVSSMLPDSLQGSLRRMVNLSRYSVTPVSRFLSTCSHKNSLRESMHTSNWINGGWLSSYNRYSF